jgi:hypothetical protein
MKTRPIPLKTWEVQAIREGRKTQTRRVVKPQPPSDDFLNADNAIAFVTEKTLNHTVRCPYGQSGDVLWVQETWALPSDSDGNDIGYQFKADYSDSSEDWKWKPSIHMPREAARLFLRIKAVRVERLQEISEDDAKNEGIYYSEAGEGYEDYLFDYSGKNRIELFVYAKDSFQSLWQSINGPESWEANPWVWVVEFERISREEAGL